MNRAIAVAVSCLVLASGCGSSNASKPKTTSLTPRVTTGSVGVLLNPALLTTADLRSLPGAPPDVHVAPVNDAHLFQDPDPRTPCGRPLRQPGFGAGAGVSIQSQTMAGFEFVIAESTKAASSYVNAVAADTRAGCPAYQTRTNTGGTQANTLIARVSLATSADEQTGAVLQISNAGHTSFAFEAVLGVGDRLGITVVISASEPRPDFVRALAARAADLMRAT